MAASLRAGRSRPNWQSKAHRALWPEDAGLPALEPPGAYDWLKPGPGRLKETILAELGRLEDEALIRTAADFVCQHRMPTDRAIVGLRRLRGGQKFPRRDSLLDELTHVVDRYKHRYPTTTWSEIQATVAELEEIITTVAGAKDLAS